MIKRKVLGLFPWFGCDRTGGAELSGRLAWQKVYREITRLNGEAVLFTYGRGESTYVHDAGHRVLVAPTRWEALRQALLCSFQPDLVLIWHMDLLKLLPLFRVRQAQVTLMLLGIEAWREQDWLTRSLLKRVDQFLTISDHTWRRFLDFHPHLASKAHQTVHLGLSNPAPLVSHSYPDQVAMLMVSRLARSEDYKGHRELITAWPAVLRRIPDAQLWIAGEGDLRPELESLVESLKLEQHVRFTGWVTEEEKQRLLTESACFAMPSRSEGFGLVYLEAMRLGRPCLVSTLDSGREVINPPEAGLAVNPDAPEAMVDAVCRLLTPGAEWERWSKQARERYESLFTQRHFSERLMEALRLGEQIEHNTEA